MRPLERELCSYLTFVRTTCFAERFERSGPPQIFNLWGERRQPSPNDVGVILCDRLAERERKLLVLFFLIKNPVLLYRGCQHLYSSPFLSV